MLPALLRMSEKSFNVALLGSTPSVSENSFVAISILEILYLKIEDFGIQRNWLLF